MCSSNASIRGLGWKRKWYYIFSEKRMVYSRKLQKCMGICKLYKSVRGITFLVINVRGI